MMSFFAKCLCECYLIQSKIVLRENYWSMFLLIFKFQEKNELSKSTKNEIVMLSVFF